MITGSTTRSSGGSRRRQKSRSTRRPARYETPHAHAALGLRRPVPPPPSTPAADLGPQCQQIQGGVPPGGVGPDERRQDQAAHPGGS
eukprot:5533654-Prymnesium_polylepis.1